MHVFNITIKSINFFYVSVREDSIQGHRDSLLYFLIKLYEVVLFYGF